MADINLPAAFASFDRATLASAVEVLVAVLDTMDGDTDIEPNGDERDGSLGEDDFCPQGQNWLGHPGCPVSDPGGCEHDGREPDDDDKGDQAWVEWHTLGNRQKWGTLVTDGREDDEDSDPREEDDPSGQCDEDGVNTSGPMQQVDTGPGCPLSDEDRDNPADRAGHRKRIQRTRCYGRYRWYLDLRSSKMIRELAGYQLLREPIAPTRRSLLRRKRGMPRRPRA